VPVPIVFHRGVSHVVVTVVAQAFCSTDQQDDQGYQVTRERNYRRRPHARKRGRETVYRSTSHIHLPTFATPDKNTSLSPAEICMISSANRPRRTRPAMIFIGSSMWVKNAL